MKDKLGGKMVIGFVALIPTAYSYLTNEGDEDKKAKGTKKCAIKRKLEIKDYKRRSNTTWK